MVEHGNYYDRNFDLVEGKSVKTNVKNMNYHELTYEPKMYEDENVTGTPKSLEKWRELYKTNPFDWKKY